MDADYERENNPGGTKQCIFRGGCVVFLYNGQFAQRSENARVNCRKNTGGVEKSYPHKEERF